MSRILLAAQLDGYTPRKDRTVSVRFVTQELTPEKVMKIHEELDQYGVLYFRAGDEPMTDEEVDVLDSVDVDVYDKPKTQSQRIRNVLYKMFERNNEGFEDFKKFYQYYTEKIIDHFKQRIDER